MAQWEKVWSFKTGRFIVELALAPCDDDPADHFFYDGCEDEIERIRNGDVAWFDARVRVLLAGREVGADYLSCCAYEPASDFWTSHRQHKQQTYFGDMVREAICAARTTLSDAPIMRRVA